MPAFMTRRTPGAGTTTTREKEKADEEGDHCTPEDDGWGWAVGVGYEANTALVTTGVFGVAHQDDDEVLVAPAPILGTRAPPPSGYSCELRTYGIWNVDLGPIPVPIPVRIRSGGAPPFSCQGHTPKQGGRRTIPSLL